MRWRVPDPFYLCKEWIHKRVEVFKLDKHECQICKAQGKYSYATIVHHIYHLAMYPQFALDIFVTDPITGKRERNLISVCKYCHENICHPERLTHKKEPLTKERW